MPCGRDLIADAPAEGVTCGESMKPNLETVTVLRIMSITICPTFPMDNVGYVEVNMESRKNIFLFTRMSV